MSCFEYMNIPIWCFPPDIIDNYNIIYFIDKYSFFYLGIHKGVYGLKQPSGIYFYPLVNILKPPGYNPLRSNSEIWCHKTLPTKFPLCVYDLGIKFTNHAHAHHIVNTLQK